MSLGTVTVNATATDNVSVLGVQFLLDGALLGAEDTSAPYSVIWDTVSALNGVHVFAAQARDQAGNIGTSAVVTVTVNNPPVLDILQPVQGQIFNATSVVNVTYTALGDLTGVDHVHFQLDSNLEIMDRDFDGAYQFANALAGTHLLKGYLVRADHSKILGSDDTVSFSTTVPDLSPPTVSVTAPLAGATLNGVATLSANASDDTGVAGVQFQFDGVNLGTEDTVAPYSLPFNTTTVLNGPHTVTAVARDLVNNVVTSQAVSVTVSNAGLTDPSVIGQWLGPYDWPFVAIHVTLLLTGEVLAWDDHTEAQGMYMWHPSTGLITTFPQSPNNLWCSGHTALSNGHLLIAGGTGLTFNFGIPDVAVYNPATQTFAAVAPMKYARYYPTLISLPDGNAVVFSGTDDCGSSTCIQDIPERYNRLANTWTELPGARLALPYYPNIFVLPDGRLLNTSASEEPLPTRVLNLATETWTTLDTNVESNGSSAMYLPGKIVRSGTAGNPNTTIQATATTQVLDITQSPPQWRSTTPMAFPRSQHNLTLLPDGTVLVTGGGRSSNANDLAVAVHEAELWSPATETWTMMSAMQTPRLYHGTALLLPDGRVLVAGSGRPTGLGADQFNAEIFLPPYLFKGPRPTIASAPSLVLHGSTFFVGTSDAARIVKASLIRLGSVTHAFNIDQRYLELAHQASSGGLNIQAPANSNLAPPGHYMLFLVDTNGVPSTAAMVQLPALGEDSEPPTAPSSLTAATVTGRVALSWTAASDNIGVVEYNVYRSTVSGFLPSSTTRIGQSATTTFLDASVAASGTYFYLVTAEDATQNVSLPSNEAVVTTVGDTIAPTSPLNVSAAALALDQISVAWSPSTDDVGVAGYYVFRNGSQIGSSNTTTLIDAGLLPSTTYMYRVTAYDAAGNMSAQSLPANAATPADNAFVAAYSFNEGSGTTLLDRSGNGNVGTLSGPTWITTGKFGGALLFNGTSDWVTVNDSNNSLHFTTGMTVEAWIYPSSQSGWRTVAQKEVDAYFLHASSNGTLFPAGGGTVNGAVTYTTASSAVPVNTWSHLALTYDGTTIRLYVNGSLVSSQATPGTLDVGNSPLRIGGNSAYGEYFQGRIDEVRLYRRALSAAEIQTDMNTPVP